MDDLKATEQFRAAMGNRNLQPPAGLVGDGKVHRCQVVGRHGQDGAYVLHLDGLAAGGFQNHVDGLGWEDWRADVGRALTPEEVASHQERMTTIKAAREADEAQRRAAAADRAARIWAESKPCPNHPYLAKKGVQSHGLRLDCENLVVPIYTSSGKLASIQTITPSGDKRFLPNGRKQGCFFMLGNADDGRICIAEGFATGASIHEATGEPVAVAFDCGNLLPVAKALRNLHPISDLVICADDDLTQGNPGRTKAQEAARAVNGRVVLPDWGDDRPAGATDFNDLAQARGLGVVRDCIEAQEAPEMPPPPCDDDAPHSDGPVEWPEPQPLASKVEPEPYPLEALPQTVRAAVDEVLGFVQAPVPLVASSAIAALSLSTQAHNDIKRAEKLSGPVGLFFLTIADSGERKSTCDGFFTRAIQDYEAEQAEIAKPLLKTYKAAFGAWEAKVSGIKDGIRAAAKARKDTQLLEADLRKAEDDKPEPPRVPRLRYADATPESLKFNLAKVWPSGGVMSSEAGNVFGSHGMGKDSIVRNLALYDQLWDGADIATERRTSESFMVRGGRLTIGLQVQEATLRAFLDQSGDLARGIGFLARCLVAWPTSTQGARPFQESPDAWPHLAAFNRRISAILNQEAPIDEDGALTPAMLTFTTEAKAAWVAFHDRIERELGDGGRFRDVRDVASKIADNAARMAALFHVFEGAAGDAVGIGNFNSAARITEWHLNEARRFFGELAMPSGLADAARLEAWIVGHCERNGMDRVPTKEVQRLGPSSLREKTKIEAAVAELEELGRAQRLREGKRKFIAVNPALLPSNGRRNRNNRSRKPCGEENQGAVVVLGGAPEWPEPDPSLGEVI